MKTEYYVVIQQNPVDTDFVAFTRIGPHSTIEEAKATCARIHPSWEPTIYAQSNDVPEFATKDRPIVLKWEVDIAKASWLQRLILFVTGNKTYARWTVQK